MSLVRKLTTENTLNVEGSTQLLDSSTQKRKHIKSKKRLSRETKPGER